MPGAVSRMTGACFPVSQEGWHLRYDSQSVHIYEGAVTKGMNGLGEVIRQLEDLAKTNIFTGAKQILLLHREKLVEELPALFSQSRRAF